jgi:hypothetical protein
MVPVILRCFIKTRGLSQLSNVLYSELPHLLCINEHHLKDLEMAMMSVEYYKLGAKFCRHYYKNGSIDFSTIPTHHICKENNLEICSIKLNIPKIKIAFVTIYRSPTGNCNYFLREKSILMN